MNPRIYNFTSVNADGKPTTSQHRQAEYRKAVALGMTMPEYREHVAYLAQKAKNREWILRLPLWSGLPEFLTMIGIDLAQAIFVGAYSRNEPKIKGDFVTVHAAWKRTIAQLHPDRDGGDEIQAKRLNELWAKYKGMFPEEVPTWKRK
jgi:hypothetical protein